MHELPGESRRSFFGSASLKAVAAAAGGVVGGLLLRSARASAEKPLRPPGAGSEEDFLAACIRCNQCVAACPTEVLHTTRLDADINTGTPYLVAREQPCDLCKGRQQMECITVCPTDALRPMERAEVRMGKAVINRETCLPWVGVSCKACWHACPFPSEAIIFDDLGRAVVVEEACVGCGLCEHVCLTDVPAIWVIPQAEWDARKEVADEKMAEATS